MNEVKRLSLDMQFAKSQVKHDDNGELCLYKDYAALQQRMNAVVAENQMARQRLLFIRALGVSIIEHSGGRMDWRGAIQDATDLVEAINTVYADTPATDAILNAMRAEGLKMAIDHMNNQTSDDCADVTVLPVISMYNQLRADAAKGGIDD